MRIILTIVFLVALSSTLVAQNKSLGVGTATPNTNAALHVESPTNNQGIIIPRLTTAQRAAMTLAAGDEGLMVYDTDNSSVYTWSGSAWESGDVAQKIALPYRDSVTTALTEPLIFLQYNNPNATQMFYLQRFDTTNVTNPFVIDHYGRGATMVLNQRGTLGTGFISALTNSVNPQPAVRGTTIGTGPGVQGINNGTGNGFAGSFSVNQPSNSYPAIQANSKGTGSAIRAFQGATDGPGPGVDVFMFNTSSSAPGISVDHQGLGSAGNFIINNDSSSSNSIYSQTNGTGAAISALNSGNGRSGYFEKNGSSGPAVTVVTNAGGSSHGLESFHNGVGDAIYAQAGGGSAGNFQNTNAGNPASALFGITNSTSGHAIGAMNTAEGSAFSIFQGGMKISTFEVTSGATIGTRAAAYRITGGGPSYSITFASDTGDMYMVYNDTAGSITFEGVTIPSGTGKIVINFNSGSFRGL